MRHVQKFGNREKLLYTNDTQHLYGVCQNLLTVVAPKHLDGAMAEYLGKLHNGREYLSHSFKTFMASHGILHQTSCVYTPQQNGTNEHKNRHLVETTRIILIHSDVPQRFLGDVILSACYLINHMLSLVLDEKFLILFYFHMTLSTPYLPKFLGPHALFIILIIVLINYLLGCTNVFF